MAKCPNCGKDTFHSEDRIFICQSRENIDLNLNFCNWNCLFNWLKNKMEFKESEAEESLLKR